MPRVTFENQGKIFPKIADEVRGAECWAEYYGTDFLQYSNQAELRCRRPQHLHGSQSITSSKSDPYPQYDIANQDITSNVTLASVVCADNTGANYFEKFAIRNRKHSMIDPVLSAQGKLFNERKNFLKTYFSKGINSATFLHNMRNDKQMQYHLDSIDADMKINPSHSTQTSAFDSSRTGVMKDMHNEELNFQITPQPYGESSKWNWQIKSAHLSNRALLSFMVLHDDGDSVIVSSILGARDTPIGWDGISDEQYLDSVANNRDNLLYWDERITDEDCLDCGELYTYDKTNTLFRNSIMSGEYYKFLNLELFVISKAMLKQQQWTNGEYNLPETLDFGDLIYLRFSQDYESEHFQNRITDSGNGVQGGGVTFFPYRGVLGNNGVYDLVINSNDYIQNYCSLEIRGNLFDTFSKATEIKTLGDGSITSSKVIGSPSDSCYSEFVSPKGALTTISDLFIHNAYNQRNDSNLMDENIISYIPISRSNLFTRYGIGYTYRTLNEGQTNYQGKAGEEMQIYSKDTGEHSPIIRDIFSSSPMLNMANYLSILSERITKTHTISTSGLIDLAKAIFIPTHKDYRTTQTIDLTNGGYTAYSDVYRCPVCNVKVIVICGVTNRKTTAECPQCKTGLFSFPHLAIQGVEEE